DFDFSVGSFTDLFDNLFGDLFGSKKRRERAAGRDLRYTLEIDFAAAANGCERAISFSSKVDCEACQGSGAKGGESALKTCSACAGRGEIKVQQGFFSVG